MSKNNEEIIEPKYHAIVYSDGSSRPNPGFWGFGVHGYIYSDKTLGTKSGDRPSNYIVSDIGYVETNIAQKTEHNTVIPECYIDGYGSYASIGTNNTGEIMGIIGIIDELSNLSVNNIKISTLLIKCDSKYAIGVFHKVYKKLDWRSTVTSNIEYYEDMERKIDMARQSGMDISIVKVEAHATAIGNNIADRMAFLGRDISTHRKIDEVNIKYTEAKKYWKPKIEKHPHMPYGKLFFLNTDTEKPVYVILDYKKDVEPGKRSHEAAFGLVMPGNRIEEIDDVVKTYSMFLRGVNLISSINLDVLYSQFVYHYKKLFGTDVFTYTQRGKKFMSVLEGEPLCTEITPPGLAKQALEATMSLSRHISEYQNKSSAMAVYTDITDIIYDTNDKGAKVIKIDNVTKSIMLDYKTKSGVDVKIPIQFGKDIIPRNQLKKLEKLEPVITLLVHELTPESIEYYMIIETKINLDISIWCNYFSNKVFLKKVK